MVEQWGTGEHTISSEEFADEEVVDDAATGADGDVHIVGLLPEAVEVVVALTIRGLPRGLLRKPPPAPLLPILRLLLAAGGGLGRSRRGGRAENGREGGADASSAGGSEVEAGAGARGEEDVVAVAVRSGGEGSGCHGEEGCAACVIGGCLRVAPYGEGRRGLIGNGRSGIPQMEIIIL